MQDIRKNISPIKKYTYICKIYWNMWNILGLEYVKYILAIYYIITKNVFQFRKYISYILSYILKNIFLHVESRIYDIFFNVIFYVLHIFFVIFSNIWCICRIYLRYICYSIVVVECIQDIFLVAKYILGMNIKYLWITRRISLIYI